MFWLFCLVRSDDGGWLIIVEGGFMLSMPISSSVRSDYSDSQIQKTSKIADALVGVSNTSVNFRSLTDYLDSSATGAHKTLVIGCGRTPENVVMGFGANAMDGTQCSLNRRHSKDFTIDISRDAAPNLVVNLLQKKTINADLEKLIELEVKGFRKFDEVIFEYLAKGLPGKKRENTFLTEEIDAGIVSANNLLKVGGKIIFYNGCDEYRGMAINKMNDLGYKEVAEKRANGHIYCEGTKKHV